MIKGVITCKCCQLFGFETTQEKVACPSCKTKYLAKEYEVIEPETIEEPQSEVTEDGADI